jgi:hypothetical protein
MARNGQPVQAAPIVTRRLASDPAFGTAQAGDDAGCFIDDEEPA